MEPDLFPKRDEIRPQQPSPNVRAPPPTIQRMHEGVNDVAARLSVLEERLANLRKKSQLTEQGMIDYEKEMRADLKALTERFTEMARKVSEVKETIDAMAGELSSVVKKHEFTVLERYLDLWQPLTFVTREEAKLLIKDALKK